MVFGLLHQVNHSVDFARIVVNEKGRPDGELASRIKNIW